MPRKKKTAREMTTEELACRVFPKKVKRELDRVAHEGDDKPPKSPKSDSEPSP